RGLCGGIGSSIGGGVSSCVGRGLLSGSLLSGSLRLSRSIVGVNYESNFDAAYRCREVGDVSITRECVGVLNFERSVKAGSCIIVLTGIKSSLYSVHNYRSSSDGCSLRDRCRLSLTCIVLNDDPVEVS